MKEGEKEKERSQRKNMGAHTLATWLGDDQSRGLSYNLPCNTLDCEPKHREKDLY